MAAVIIRRKDILRLGKELLEEIFDFLYNEFFLSKFEELKVLQKIFMDNLKSNYISIEDGKVGELKYLNNDIESIYNVVRCINFNMELDEDLYYKKMAYKDIFRVFETSHIYLDD